MTASASFLQEYCHLPQDEIYRIDRRWLHVHDQEEYQKMYERSINEPEAFWTEAAYSLLEWQSPFKKVKYEDFNTGDVQWFIGGKLNACENCVDKWARRYPHRTALIWEGDEPGTGKNVTYGELLEEVCRVANVLRNVGNVKKGDRVTIYMPMVPETIYTMLACARIGAIHSVVFAGFSAVNLHERIIDAHSEVIVCMDYQHRGGRVMNLETTIREAVSELPFVKKVFVFSHPLSKECRKKENGIEGSTGAEVSTEDNRFTYMSDILSKHRPFCAPETMDSEDLLFMLYTSGSTGKPKGIAHSTAGYLVYAGLTHRIAFDYRPGDIWACVADVGWITGHSYIVYGPLLNGAATVLFESVPTYPDCGRYWDLVQRHKVTHFYTAPTAIRTIMRHGDEIVKKYDRSSLRVLGSVGEPINPEAWRWYFNVVGDAKCPVIDTYWQTETGGFIITPLPCFKLKPGSASLPFFGIKPSIIDSTTGEELLGPGVKGSLVIKGSWPGMMRTLWNDHERMLEVYFSHYKGMYYTGDGCIRDRDGYLWIMGRVDDVIKVSGHRIGSAEVEHALVQHKSVSEAAVVGFPHEIKGEGIFCFVSLKMNCEVPKIQALKQIVRQMIGPLATPDIILLTPALPKTRSGKIMRRILRKIVNDQHDELGDISTLADPSVVADLISQVATAKTSQVSK